MTSHARKGPSRHSGTNERGREFDCRFRTCYNFDLPPLLKIALSGWQTDAEIFDLRLDVNAQGSPRNLQGTTFVCCAVGFPVSSRASFSRVRRCRVTHATTIDVLPSVIYAFAGVRSGFRLGGERESSELRSEPSSWKA